MSGNDIEELLAEVTSFVREVSPATVTRVAGIVRESDHPERAQPALAALPSGEGARRVLDLARVWARHPWVNGIELAMALRAAEAATRASERAQSLELVWTGPESRRIPSRRTDQVLYGLAREARSHLLIVSFVAYGVERLADLIREAADRRVAVDLILESREQSDGEIDFNGIRALEPLPSGTRVFCWPLEKRLLDERGRHGVLHAKTLVVDGRAAFVTSANLTGRALERNMELGVVIRGGPLPARIVKHFHDLIDRAVLAPWG